MRMLLLWFGIGVGTQVGWAAEASREFRSARFLGMGDAGVAIATGHDALFYNPAGIADTDGILNEIVIASPEVSVSARSQRLYQDFKENEDFFSLLESVRADPQHVAVQNFTGLVFRRAALGTVQRGQVDLMVGTNPENGLLTANFKAVARAGFMAGFARELFDKTLLVGIDAKVLQKAEADVAIDVLSADELGDIDTKNLMDEYLHRGTGFGADLGLLWIPKVKSNFRLGVALRNVADTRYRWPVPATASIPSDDKQQLDVGIAVQPSANRSKLTFAADLRDVTGATKENIYKRLHLGAGLSLRNFLGFMGGINQGYVTYGAFLNFRIVRTEIGMYSEEMGKFPGDLRSQRVFARVMVGWAQ